MKEQPSPEELAILQKYCKHSNLRIKKSVEFLKVGEKQPAICDNCQLKFELSVAWDKYISDDKGPLSCYHCGCFMKKGEECNVASGEYAHGRCEWGEDW